MDRPSREEEEEKKRKKKEREMDRSTEKKKKKKKKRGRRRRRSSCFTAPPLLRHCLLPFLLLLCFLSLQMKLFVFRPGIHLSIKIVRFRRYSQYAAGTTGIFSGTKQEDYLYRCTDRYGIYRPYRPVQ